MRIVHDPAVYITADDVPGDRGRRVETQTELLPGDLALRASAHAVVLLPELWSSHCHKCLVGSDLRRLSRCGCCRTVYYCSKKCQQIDWRLDHQKECKSFKQLVQLGLTSDQVMDVVLLGRVLRRKDAEGLKPMELVWYEEDLQDQELILLAALAQKLNLVDADLYSTDEMLRMLSRFRNNNFSISDELLLPLGAGCFPLGAMINHSCDPNCAVTFVPETLDMEFRAMRPIKAGQEVTQTYVDVALPRRERQQRLQRKYHFCCNCARCAQSLQDSTCLDAFLDADIDGCPQEFWTQECQDEVEQALKEASDAASRGAGETDLAMQQQHRIEALEKLAERQGDILHRENIAQLQTLSTLFSAEIERGSVRATCRYGERMLEFYRRVYSLNHPMTGLHLFTLGDLYDQLAQSGAELADCRNAKSVEYLAEAQRILRTTHGKGHRLVALLADRLDHRGRGSLERRSQQQ